MKRLTLVVALMIIHIGCLEGLTFGGTIQTPYVYGPYVSPDRVFVGTEYGFHIEGDIISDSCQLEYFIDWGDGSDIEWHVPNWICGFHPCMASYTHTWSSVGTYAVRTKARCPSNNLESEWSSSNFVVFQSLMPFVGFLEFPKDGQRVSGISSIRGWALDEKGITNIELLIDGNLIAKIPYGGVRDDVKAVFGGYPDSEGPGFCLAWNYSSLAAGKHTLTVRFYNPHGARQDLAANITVVKFDGYEMVDSVNPSKVWLRSVQVTADGGTRPYDIRIEWSNETQGFQIVDIVPR